MFFVFTLVFVLGLVIGSFLNCVIYRLEKQESLGGRSYCPHCNHTLAWLDLIPLVSFLILQGKCRYCHKKISLQYPLVEFLTGILFLAVFIKYFTPFAGVFDILFLFYIISSLVVIFVYDLKHYIIPDKILFPAIAVAFLYQLFLNPSSFLGYLLAALIASGFFLVIFIVSQGRWIGFGDVKLAVLMGLVLGLPAIFVSLFLAFMFGAIIGLSLMLVKKKGLKSEVPFAPFLIGGTFMALFFSKGLIGWYFNLFI